MDILQMVYGKHQMVHVLDHRHKLDAPCYVIDIDYLLDGHWVAGIPDCIITPESPHYEVMVRHDYWDIGTLHHVITEHQKAVFDVVMKVRLQGLGVNKGLVLYRNGVEWRFVQNPDGGMDEHLHHKGKNSVTRHHHTLDEVIDALWKFEKDVDEWRDFNSADYTEDDEQFANYIRPRLEQIRKVPQLVLVARGHTDYQMVVSLGKYGILKSVIENLEGYALRPQMAYQNDDVLIETMSLHNPICTEWCLLQQEETGRFNTIFTQDWNTDGAE